MEQWPGSFHPQNSDYLMFPLEDPDCRPKIPLEVAYALRGGEISGNSNAIKILRNEVSDLLCFDYLAILKFLLIFTNYGQNFP